MYEEEEEEEEVVSGDARGHPMWKMEIQDQLPATQPSVMDTGECVCVCPLFVLCLASQVSISRATGCLSVHSPPPLHLSVSLCHLPVCQLGQAAEEKVSWG